MDSIIVPLMNRLFGDVFANIERDQLELTLWNGKVQFKDLVLNAGVLIKQGIPLQIVRGKIANLTLDIPWKELTAKPLTVGLEGLSLELKIAPDHYDPDLDFEIEQAYKKSRLSRNECLPDPVQDTYSSRLVNAAISNLNVLIRNVLIKFQDIDGRNVVESEFSMNALSIATCGPDFFQGASKETSPIANVIYKLIKLTDVAISCQRFELGKMTLESQNLIAPVSGQGNLKLSKTASPIYDFEILLDNFGVICTDQQLQILLNIVDSIHRKSRRKAHLRHRPPESVPVKLDPKAWFQYSVKSILQDIQAKNREWSWTHFKERRDQRRAYISLYRKYLSNECFPEEISQLEEFETILALEDILWYRQVAAKGLSPMPKTRSSKWIDWLTGAGSYRAKTEEAQALMEKELARIYEEEVNYQAADGIKLRLLVKLRSGKLELISCNKKVISAVLDWTAVSYTGFTDRFSADVKVSDFNVNGNVVKKYFEKGKSDTSKDLITVNYIHKPVGGPDSELNVKVVPIIIHWQPELVKNVLQFFDIKEDAAKSGLVPVQEAARVVLNSVEQQAKVGLIYAIESRISVFLNIEASAPIFVIPNPDSETNLVINMGKLTVKSDLGERNLSDMSIEDLEKAAYDRYTVSVSEAQMYIEDSIQNDVILEKIGFTVYLANCIVPERRLTKFKIDGSSKQLKMDLSERKITIIQQAIRIINNSFERGTEYVTEIPWSGPGLDLSNEERKVTLDGRLLEAHFEIGLLSLDLSSFNQKHITLGLSSIQLSALVDCNTFVRVSAETFGNYQNILNSHWEPFLEEVQVFARLDIIEGATNVEIDIPKRLELNLSKIFIDIAQNWRVGTKSAESTSQLIFRNRTGCLVTISSGNHEISLNHDSEIEWPTRFIEKVSMKFGDSLDSINDIYLEKIGVQPYFFPGKRIEPLNRCNVTVQILDAIKFITISSVYAFYNSTTDNIEIARMDEKAVIDLTTVYPGKMFNFGIQDWFQNLFVLRPSSKFNWSNPINWKEFSAKSGRQTLNFSSTDQLLKHTVSLSVKNHGSDNPFCLINACAPIMLENLLPYSLNYLLTDASTSKSDKPLLGNLDSGQIIGITSICPEGDLELNLSIPKLRLKTQKSVRIAQKSGSKAKKEIILFDDDEKSITLRLSYSEIDAISKQITISCPYLVFNRSDVSLIFGYKSNFRIEEVAVGIPLESSGAQYSQQPILFSFPNYRPVGSRSYLKVRDGGWSDPVSFEAINTSYLVKVPVSDQLSKQVAITVIPGTGRYAMSNLIYCDPRFVIWNKTAFTIYLRHATTKRGLTIDPGQKLSVTEVENNSEFFQFRIDGYQWTNPFEIKNLGTIHIAVSSLSKERRLFKVSIDISGSTLFVTVDLCEIWPFQLENNTKKWFVYYQRGQNTNYNLPPNEKNVYSWDSLSEPEKLLVLHYEGVECAIDLKNVEKKIIIGDSKGKNEIIVSLALNPETTILTVNDAESAPARELQTKNQNDVSKVVSSIKINVEGLGISCVNENAEEFIYFSAKHLEFISQEFLRQFLYSASIKWFQLDNQSDVGTSEVVIYPTMLSSKDATENDKPVFFTSLLQYKDSKACVQSFKLFTILLQELSLDIDSDFLEMIFKVFMFAPSTESNLQSSKVTKAPSLEFPETCEKATKLYFDSFLLQPMKFNISYSQISTINLGANNRKSRNEIIGFAVDLLSHTAGNIHDAQIKLNALVLNHLSWTTDELFKSLAEFYTKQFLAQLHHILGSSDLLGNPVGLFSNVSSGVKNMFYDPIVGFEITNPAKFGIDVAAGTSNLLKKTLFGLTDSVAKVTGSVAQGLSVLTLDSNYQRKRQNAKRNKPKHLGQGLTKGAKSFARGIASGVSGIVTNPRDDVKKHGAVGVMSGVGKGLFGLVSKPVVGAVDFATDVVDGFKNTTTLGEQEIGRIRPKRYIGKDKVLLVIDINKPYNETLARISEMLTKIDNGKYSNEGLVSHIDLNDEENRSQSNIASNKTLVPKDANLNVLVLTEKRILLVTGSKVEAHIPLEDILRVSIDKNDLVVENSTKTLCVQVPNLELANKFKSDVEKFKTKQVGE